MHTNEGKEALLICVKILKGPTDNNISMISFKFLAAVPCNSASKEQNLELNATRSKGSPTQLLPATQVNPEHKSVITQSSIGLAWERTNPSASRPLRGGHCRTSQLSRPSGDCCQRDGPSPPRSPAPTRDARWARSSLDSRERKRSASSALPSQRAASSSTEDSHLRGSERQKFLFNCLSRRERMYSVNSAVTQTAFQNPNIPC